MTARDPITMSLLGEPVAFARARISRGGIHYTPAPQRNIMAALRMAGTEALAHAGNPPPLDEPISLELLAEFQIPASFSKKKRAAAILGEILPAKKPDLDNLWKLAADSLGGVVFRDDSLIVSSWCRKVYGVQPKLVVTISPIFKPAADKPPAISASRIRRHRLTAAAREAMLPLDEAPP